MDLLDDLLSSPFDGVSTVAGEASDESEEGEDIGDLGDIVVTPITAPLNTNESLGEGSESEEGEDIGDIVEDLVSTPIVTPAHGEAEEEEEGEDIGVDVTDLVATPIPMPAELTGKEEKSESAEAEKKRVKEPKTKEPSVPPVSSIQIPQEAFDNLSTSFLDTYKDPLAKMHESLAEFSHSQGQLLEFLQKENEKQQQLPADLRSAIALVRPILLLYDATYS